MIRFITYEFCSSPPFSTGTQDDQFAWARSEVHLRKKILAVSFSFLFNAPGVFQNKVVCMHIYLFRFKIMFFWSFVINISSLK